MKYIRLLQVIDAINMKTGRVMSFAFLAIMLIQVMDVVLRYVFNSPTIWAWDINSMIFRAIAIMGGGYVLLEDAHVRMDLIYRRTGRRVKLVFDLISYPLIILAFILVIWKGWDMAWTAWTTKAHSPSAFGYILWPVKSTLFIGGFLILLQTVSNFSRAIISFKMECSGKKLGGER